MNCLNVMFVFILIWTVCLIYGVIVIPPDTIALTSTDFDLRLRIYLSLNLFKCIYLVEYIFVFLFFVFCILNLFLELYLLYFSLCKFYITCKYFIPSQIFNLSFLKCHFKTTHYFVVRFKHFFCIPIKSVRHLNATLFTCILPVIYRLQCLELSFPSFYLINFTYPLDKICYIFLKVLI